MKVGKKRYFKKYRMLSLKFITDIVTLMVHILNYKKKFLLIIIKICQNLKARRATPGSPSHATCAQHMAIFYEGIFSKPLPCVATKVGEPHSFDPDPTQLNKRKVELWIQIQHFKGMRIRIWIYGFDDQKLKKKLQLKKI
jgi:hypothetical protein